MAVSVQRFVDPTTGAVIDDSVLPPHELALDYFTLGGQRSPGKCEVRGASREYDWLKLEGVGIDGASLSLQKRILVEFEIDVKIVSQAELNAWNDFYDAVLSKPVYWVNKTTKESSRALGIYHPRLAALGIGMVVIKRVGQFVPTKGGGEVATITFLEYRAPRVIRSKPNGSIPAAAKAQPKAKDALDLSIEEETQRGKSLAIADNALGTFGSRF